MTHTYKFQQLDVYRLALDYIRAIYSLKENLPDHEKYNQSNQIIRAATSIALNIAEGSTGQSNLEQKRFLGLALRSYLETIACLDLIEELEYLSTIETKPIREQGHQLFVKIIAFRKALS